MLVCIIIMETGFHLFYGKLSFDITIVFSCFENQIGLNLV